MRLIYFGTRLSENISRREPEGYLICLNVPVARTGTQEYLPSELGLALPDSRTVPVQRPEEEVFAPACLASFEGMPVTDDHPSSPDGVNAENIRFLQKGHAHNVRRGAPPEEDLLLADLIITDPRLIEEIMDGKREISCGYNYILSEEDGTYFQREIRGNHVAVVDAGRAGPRVSIKDSVGTPPPGSKDRTAADGNRPVQKSGRFSSNERRKAMNKRNLCFAKMMTRMARDGEAEALAEMIGEILEEETEAVLPSPAPDAPEEPVIVEAPEDQPVLVDCGPEILAALNRIIGLLSAGAGADCGRPGCQRDGDPDDDAEAAGEAAEAVEALAEAAAEAVAEAVETAAESPEPDAPDDPVGELIAEILEGENGAEGGPSAESVQGEILSGILEPEEDEDSPSEPDSRAEDALRAALAVFRPQLQRMSSGERKRFNADVAARMRKLTRGAAPSGRPGSYAALRRAAARDRSARDLGRRIMASRNANMKR